MPQTTRTAALKICLALRVVCGIRGLLFWLPQRPDVINHVPHVFVADPRAAVQAFHGAVHADTVPDIDEDLAIR